MNVEQTNLIMRKFTQTWFVCCRRRFTNNQHSNYKSSLQTHMNIQEATVPSLIHQDLHRHYCDIKRIKLHLSLYCPK